MATAWDGVKEAYLPPEELRISPKLRLHDRADREVDPITFEVIRHRLWNSVVEHGWRVIRGSGSPICQFAHDMNPVLLTERGDLVYYGPFLQYLAAGLDSTAKWIIENRSDEPGIEDGDAFLCNDPWIGANHSEDVSILVPVFIEGELFCWIGNELHQYDLGGTTPGSFCPDAPDAFHEATIFPAVRIMRQGKIQVDIEGAYLRASRMPDLVALDLRAQLAGIHVARQRVLEIVQRYGPETVKAVMRKIIDDSEEALVRRLRAIPNGEWRDEVFFEVASPGDRRTFRLVLILRKRGDRLVFSNEGTDPQVGSLNQTFLHWKGSILGAISNHLLWDQLFAVGGAQRHIDFEPVSGTITCASWPAATSCSSPLAGVATVGMASTCLSKMLMTDPDQRHEVNAKFGSNPHPMVLVSGVNQYGQPFGSLLLDAMAAPVGAFSFRDGVGTGGYPFDPRVPCANVEDSERVMPVLYLYRYEMPDSGGAGKFRGGNSAVVGIVAHGTDEVIHSTAGGGCAVPTATGLSGGYPANCSSYKIKRNTDVRARLASGNIPTSLDELEGTEEILSPKLRNAVQGQDDVYEWIWNGGGGYGDPLDRDPASVVADVRRRDVTTKTAGDIYGVILGPAGEPDFEATDRRRENLRNERYSMATPPRRPTMPATTSRAGEGRSIVLAEYLEEIHFEDGGAVLRCRKCRHPLAEHGANYLDGLAIWDSPVTTIPLVRPPELLVDDRMVFRRYLCPECRTQVAAEIVRATDEPKTDVQILPPIE